MKATVSWQDYLEAQGPADRSIVFAIAWHPGARKSRLAGEEVGDDSWYAGNYNDLVATFVAAHPERLIGFMALRMRWPCVIPI